MNHRVSSSSSSNAGRAALAPSPARSRRGNNNRSNRAESRLDFPSYADESGISPDLDSEEDGGRTKERLTSLPPICQYKRLL